MPSPALILRHVTQRFPGSQGKMMMTLEDINLTIPRGEFFVLVGPSGCGKSTLLRIMSGLETSFSGEVILGKGLTKADFSFVFQQFALLPWLTVFQNVELGLLRRGMSEELRKTLVDRELRIFGLQKFRSAHPHELSGGMKQRVGIARALVTEPKIVFLDEPFSELDSFTAEELREELLEIWEDRKPTIVMVTHIVAEALELADRIAGLTPRPGRVEKIVRNTLPRPRDLRSKEFFALEDRLYNLIKP